MIRCANGHENPDGAQVCAECGAPLGAAPEAEQSSGGSFWARQEARSGGAPVEPAPAPPPPAPAPTPPAAAEAVDTAPVLVAPAAEPDWDVSVPDPTDDAPPAPVMAAPSSGGASDVGDRGGVIAIVGATLLFFASFLPWAKATGSLFYVTKDGIDGDGAITLLLAVVIGLVAALTLLRPPPSRVGAVLVLLGGVAGVGVTIYEMFQVDDAFDNLLSQAGRQVHVEARIGVGLYLSLLASAIVVVGAVLAFVQAHRAQNPE